MNHRPRKRFGQHFLHDPGVIRRIVDAVDPRAGETVVEIGPGLGAISTEMLERCGRLHVVELDRDVIPELRARCAGLGELVVHEADALRFDYGRLDAPEGLRLVGNLPYNVSTPLLFHLLDGVSNVRDMTFMLQKEVVDRMVAAPGTRAYGRLTVMLAAKVQVRSLFDVGRGAFNPPPKVESSVCSLRPWAAPPFEVGDPTLFAELVNLAFQRRRKTLRNALRERLTQAMMESAGIDPGARPGTVTPAGYADLTRSALAAGVRSAAVDDGT